MLWLGGALAVLALPPFFLWPVLIPSLCLLYHAVKQAQTTAQAFWRGWWWAFGYFMAGLYWMGHALLVDAAQFAWLLPLALTCIPAFLSLYVAIASALAHRYIPGHGIVPLFGFVFLLVAGEWLRGILLTGFPWNRMGLSMAFSDLTLQWASVIGEGGLSILAFLLALLPYYWWHSHGVHRYAAGIWCGLVLAMIVFGGWRLSIGAETAHRSLHARIIQPNIAQHHKWDPDLRAQFIRTQAEMTSSRSLEDIDVVIWPETAVPFFLHEGFGLMHELEKAIPPGGVLMTGALRAEGTQQTLEHIYNSVFVLKEGGRVVSYYDKRHLVPFGEYIPLREWLPLTKLTAGSRDFSPGMGDALLFWDDNVVRPLICYEAIFADEVRPQNSQAPKWLVNITNDAWFGTSPGPYQHLHMARMRAVEQGRHLVRAANTGISASIDAYGRVEASIPLNEAGLLDTEIQLYRDVAAPYASNKLLVYLPLIGLALILLIVRLKKNT